jgi:hypothetical protein
MPDDMSMNPEQTTELAPDFGPVPDRCRRSDTSWARGVVV